MEIAWTIVGIVATLLVGVGVSVLGLNPPEYVVARTCFWVSALLLGCTGLVWELRTEQPTWWRITAGILIWICVGVGLPESLRWVSKRQAPILPIATTGSAVEEPLIPSLLFVFGSPLGDNSSPIWVMMIRHYGPNPAYNCDIQFFDKDRKNIEHEWLVANPKWPFPPPGIADGESQKTLHFPEGGPANSVGTFEWAPLDPNRQHYSASITCRDGVFVENWEITRVDGILRTKITVERGPEWVKKNPYSNPILFTCTDPEFVSTPLATKIPKKGELIHPGWKPSHEFSIPVAIIDPNGHVQVLLGVTLPDGSTKTDFGCWNILTKHLP
jgi:hypothetical protein